MAFAIAIDAINLADDRRGMGRYVRRVIADWREDPDLRLTLAIRDQANAHVLEREFSLPVAPFSALRKQRLDAAWYPWNGMRFRSPAARSLTTIHDAFAFTYPNSGMVARWREQSPIRAAVAQSSALATVSRWSASQIEAALGIDARRLAIVPPVPDPFWMPVEVPHDPRGDWPYVLVVGGPDERKNLGTLFSAFRTAFFGRHIRLVVVGNLRGEDEALLAKASIPHARLHPSDERLRELYSGAILVAAPSVAEGYGLMVVEAMACGAAVVAAEAAALPESCDGAALLVPPLDVIAWRDAMVSVERDRATRDDLRARSLERAARIDRGSTARLTLELLRRSPEGAR
ncbi:MAG: glycosyltransferase family 4 protein [Vulcanimicrobiaceae bacterium]